MSSGTPWYMIRKDTVDGLIGNIRAPSDFIEAFTIPQKEEWAVRVQRNVRYYRSNYLAITLLVFLYSIIVNPSFLFVLCLIGFVWGSYLSHAGRPLGSIDIPEKTRVAICTAATIILLYITGAGSTLFWVLGLSATAVLLHATVRSPSIGSKVDDFSSQLDKTATLTSILVHELSGITSPSSRSEGAGAAYKSDQQASPRNLSDLAPVDGDDVV